MSRLVTQLYSYSCIASSTRVQQSYGARGYLRTSYRDIAILNFYASLNPDYMIYKFINRSIARVEATRRILQRLIYPAAMHYLNATKGNNTRRAVPLGRRTQITHTARRRGFGSDPSGWQYSSGTSGNSKTGSASTATRYKELKDVMYVFMSIISYTVLLWR